MEDWRTFWQERKKSQQGLPIWALWKALIGFLLVPPALLPHIPEGGPAEGCSFPLSNILRSLDYLTCKSYVTHKVPQWASEVKILQILHKPSHLKATLMCWSCYPVTNVQISFLFFFFWVVIVSELIGVVQALSITPLESRGLPPGQACPGFKVLWRLYQIVPTPPGRLHSLLGVV